MQTLGDHNSAIISYHKQLRDLRKAGVACDKCGTELVFEDNSMLTTDPPKQRVRCPSCGFSGFKLG